MRIFFIVLVALHGLIHFIGFAKAFGIGNIAPEAPPMSKSAGFVWLLTTIGMTYTAWLFFKGHPSWWIYAVIFSILSQILIFASWEQAKAGTLPNAIILVVALLAWKSWDFEQTWKKDAKVQIENSIQKTQALVTENDLEPLPLPVQRYLRYCGVVGKPRVQNMRVIFEGEMREKGKDWFPFHAEQYNTFENPSRLFFMKAKMFGVTVPGYHRYANATAIMDIRLFGLISIVRQSGPVMDKTETVTLFNDMCLMAPASLVDNRIEWQEIDSLRSKAKFTNGRIPIEATLYFDDSGRLVNFISNDRTAISDMKQYPFHTPIHVYGNQDGVPIMKEGEAIWEYPDGKFVYGRFRLKKIEYNVQSVR